MKKYIPYMTALLAILVGTGVMLAIASGGKGVVYPSFDETSVPQVKVQLERDYGYRTGDPITFTVFVDQARATVVDPTSFAVKDTNAGDLEFSSKLLGSRSLSDGSKLLAVQVTVRKWSYEQSFTLQATMSYIASTSGDTDALAVPDITLHMSPTWDGRKTLNEGNRQVVRDSQPLLNVVLIGVGLLAALLSLAFMRSARRKNTRLRKSLAPVPTSLELAHERFDLVRDLILGRDFRLQHYEELERIVRGLFDVETLTTERVAAVLGSERSWAHEDVLAILSGCDRRLYQGGRLTESEHAQIFAAFEHLLAEIPLHEVPLAPGKTRLTPLKSRLKGLPQRKRRFLCVASGWLWRHRPFRYYV
jgi:hypothetical protein